MLRYLIAACCVLTLKAGELPKELLSTVKEFQRALEAHDVKATARLAKFPIWTNEFGTISTPEQFERLFKDIFPEDRIQGLVKQMPTETGAGFYSINSKNTGDWVHFMFIKVGERYCLRAIDNGKIGPMLQEITLF